MKKDVQPNMNRIYANEGEEPLAPQEIADAANAVYADGYAPFSAADYEGENSRISGEMCRCLGNGRFLLESVYGTDEKRYMRCMECGCMSHL